MFVNILGYTLNPDTDFNLTTELKNVKDAKKADGGILVNDKVVGVIELKGTNTTDLSKVETQAFGYKNNQTNCTYVITSNFEKLRFYIDNAIEHQSFNLFELTQEQFNLLYVCLAYQNISKDTPKKIKTESLSQEDAVTKQLYRDYSLFKRELFNNLTQLNPDVDALLLFKKSQKLLDRFLFLFFAEDRHLLPPNSVRLILKQWKQLQELDAYTPLYKRFKKYFGYLNTGHKGKQYDVYPYNGGLFKPDEVLDQVKIDDDLLYAHTLKLSEYDFDSEVDVNILGHIFENSLNEIEEIQTQLEENNSSPNGFKPIEKVSKRKKDGVFYTPKYITKYIVENTVGKLCEEQKEKLNLVEDDYQLNRKKKTKEQLLQKLKDYRDWLLQLTIVDPACGSGAFLNEALNFLIAEHQYVDELETKLMGGGFVFPNVENSILENNLFGVDINNESVEIAKLSLWLRTAQPNRKLNDLSGNIKCGNSLIDDPEVAGDKAFNWEKEFPQVFQEKQKHAYHLVFTTHNSRISQRMLKYNVEKGKPLLLNTEEEIALTKIMSEIINEENYHVLAFNICKDHVHIILVCEEDEVSTIAKTLKGKSSYRYQSKGFKPIGQALWSQKYFFANLQDLSLPSTSNQTGHVFVDTYLDNAIAYVESNRSKHNLPQSTDLQNSIAEMCCTIDEAFQTEYKGGFDVVIGNPPYGAKLGKEIQIYLTNKFIKGGSETAISFLKLSHSKLLKMKGELGFIIPKSFSFSSNYKSIRDYLLDDVSKIIDCKKVWKEVKLEQVMLFFAKNNKTTKYISGSLSNNQVLQKGKIPKITFKEFGFYLNDISDEELCIARKMVKSNWFIKDIASNSRGGIFQKYLTEKGELPVLGGAEIQRKGVIGIKGYVTETKIENDEKCFINDNSLLVQRLIAHIMYPKDHIKITACYPLFRNYAIVDTINQITFDKQWDPKTFWLIFNSKLINWFSYRFILAKAIRTMQFDNPITNRLPVPTQIRQKPFIEKADQMLALNKELQEVSSKFQRSLQREFPEVFEKLPKKLQNWYELSFADFVKELNKKLKAFKGFKPLGLQEKAEWEDYFLAEKLKAINLKNQIDQTDKEIDQMVYELYGLTDEEIKIVEES